MADAIRVVSSRTVIKRVTVGTPVPHPTIIKIQTSVGQLTDVNYEDVKDGSTLIFNEITSKWTPGTLLNKQTIDGEEGF